MDNEEKRLIEIFKNSNKEDSDFKIEIIKYIRDNFLYIKNINDQFLLMEKVYSKLRGYGIIDKYLKDESISEIMVNSTKNIFIERNGSLIKVKESYESEKEIEDIIQRMVGKSGREINMSSPVVDSNLEDGSRINAIFRPLSSIGPILTIRKFKKDTYTLDDLVENESLTKEARDFLFNLVKAKYNIIISGGTGSGKTTFLNALANLCVNERLIVIEDSRELNLNRIENLIYLETRNNNSSGFGRVTIKDLIKTSLRLRPDRIIVGEVRGIEAIDMLQAMNTGHDGSFSTIHANSPIDSISRLETMILQNGDIPLKALTKQIISSIDIICYLKRLGKDRKLTNICQMCKGRDDIQLKDLFVYDRGLKKVSDLTNLEKMKRYSNA